ncbi:MAG: hypothetical protein COY39_01205 [Alphaproteobacteria bacterium CG_4_10_14_0_8_um_filter_37_21]|nr:MAG: hypothetical protein COY39_01205 [Alphaproteobacteria bacterium CG_4_10_14_0_8_um_filter_37_21]
MGDIQYFKTLASTHTYARDQYKAIQADTLIQAGVQTNGFGRRGTPWKSIAGNFHGTFIFKDANIAPIKSSELAFVFAVSTGKYLDTLTFNDYAFKWPNDLVVEDHTTGTIKKLGGILIENMSQDLLLSIGLNIAHAPNNVEPHPSVCLQELSPYAAGAFCPGELFGTLKNDLNHYQMIGFEYYETKWQKKCALKVSKS